MSIAGNKFEMKKSIAIALNLAVFAGSLLIYSLTLSHSLSFTDSGELAAAASTLGVAHPSGYPLYAIIGYIWTLLPLPMMNVVKLNLLSALFISSANVMLHNVIVTIFKWQSQQRTSKGKSEGISGDGTMHFYLAAAFLALSFGFSAIVWEQALINEVYSLHYLLTNISIYLLLLAFTNSNDKYFFTAALFIGLGFSNHLTTLLLVPSALYLFFKKKDKGFDFSANRFKAFSTLLIPFAIGLSVYLYLPIRSSMEPLFNWGYVSRGMDKLLYHMSGKQYQVWMFAGGEAWSENFAKFFGAMFDNLGLLIVLPFVIAGYYIAKRKGKIDLIFNFVFAPIAMPFSELKGKSKFLIILSVIMLLSCILYSFNYSIHDIDSYFYLGYLGLFLFLSIPVFGIIQQSKNFAWLMAVLPIAMILLNYQSLDRCDDYSVEEYTKLMIDNLPKNSIIISSQWDYFCSAFWYLQQVEGYRKDVVLIEKELMRRTWYPYQLEKWYPQLTHKSTSETAAFMKDLELFEADLNYNPMSIQMNFVNLFNSYIDKNIDSIPVFLTLDILQSEPDIAKNYHKIPYGFAFKLSKQPETLSIDKYQININKLYKSLATSNDHLHQGLRQTAAVSLLNIARYGIATEQKDKAKEYYLKAKKLDPQNMDINILSREFGF